MRPELPVSVAPNGARPVADTGFIDDIQLAVVGLGYWGPNLVRCASEIEGANVRAMCDRSATALAKLARRYPNIGGTPDLDRLLEDPEIDGIVLATPVSTHFELGRRCLEAGKHVLVEKPLATSVAEADDLVAAADQAGVVLAVGHVERFNPAVRALKGCIEAEAMGDVLSLVARRVGVFPARAEDANVILDLAIHDVDVFRYLLDADRPDDVYSNAGKARNGDLYDFADVFLRFGPVGCLLQVNWLTPVKIRSLAVTGTDGYAEVEYVTQRLAYYATRPVRDVASFAELEAVSEQPPELARLERREPLAAELEEFLKAVRGDDGEIVSGEEAKISTAIAIAAAEAAARA